MSQIICKMHCHHAAKNMDVNHVGARQCVPIRLEGREDIVKGGGELVGNRREIRGPLFCSDKFGFQVIWGQRSYLLPPFL